MENKICPQCSSLLRTIPAGVSKKTGKPYNAFQVCPNGCKQFVPYDAPKGTYNASPNASGSPTTNENPWAIVVEHLTSLETKVDQLLKDIQDNITGG